MSSRPEPPPGPAPVPPPPPPAGPPPVAAPTPPGLGGRLHPTAIAIWTSQQAVGLVVVLVFGGGPAGIGGLIVAGLLAVTVVVSIVRWSRFSWAVEAGNLVIEQGVVQRSRRVIPADRVQSVDLVRPVRHRLLGVVQVRVEAIGGGETEGQLDALDQRTAFAVQHSLLGARAARRDQAGRPAAEGEGVAPHPPGQPGRLVGPPAAAGGAPAPRRLVRVSARNLVVAGVTGGRVGVVAVLLGGLQQVAGDRFDEAFRLIPTDLGVLAAVLLAVAVIVLVFVLSIAATVVTYWNFTVMRDADELRISRGLLEQRLETVPLRRIQSLRIEQNLLRRAFGLASVKADLAGRAGSGGDAATGLLLPIGPVADARRLIAELLGDAIPVLTALSPPPARSRRRYVVRGLAAGVVTAAIATAPVVLADIPTWVPLAAGAAGAAVGLPLGLAWWRALGSAEVGGVLVARTGLLVRRRVHVPIGRVQRMSLRSSPFQRRLGLADVHIGIARSGGWEGPRMPELDIDEALALTATTVHQAVAASRR